MELTQDVYDALWSCVSFAEANDNSLGTTFSEEYFLAKQWLESNDPVADDV